MQHDDWAAKLKQLLKSTDASATDWDTFLSQTDAARLASVNDWHVQQAKGHYANYLRQNHDVAAAAKLEKQIGDDAEEGIQYWHTAAGTSLAYAALEQFKLGNNEQAVSLAKRAISHLGHTADPSPIFETLISTLRSHLQDSG